MDSLRDSSADAPLAGIEAWLTGMHAHAANPAGNAVPKACTARSIVATSWIQRACIVKDIGPRTGSASLKARKWRFDPCRTNQACREFALEAAFEPSASRKIGRAHV